MNTSQGVGHDRRCVLAQIKRRFGKHRSGSVRTQRTVRSGIPHESVLPFLRIRFGDPRGVLFFRYSDLYDTLFPEAEETVYLKPFLVEDPRKVILPQDAVPADMSILAFVFLIEKRPSRRAKRDVTACMIHDDLAVRSRRPDGETCALFGITSID